MRSVPCKAALVLGVSTLLLLAACNVQPEDVEYLNEAKELLQKGDSKGAAIALKNAIAANPQSGTARMLLGKTLLDAGDTLGALVELRKAQALQVPDDQLMPVLAQAMLLGGESAQLISQHGRLQLVDSAAVAVFQTALAGAYAAKGQPDQAAAAVESALRAKPGYADALVVKARLLALAGDVPSALRSLDEVLRADQANLPAGVLKAELLVRDLLDLKAALAAYREVLRFHPASVAARSALINLLLLDKQVDDAKTELAALKKMAPNHPETQLRESQLAYSGKDYRLVRELTSRLLQANPNNLRALELAGAAELRLRNYRLAEANLSKATKLVPSLPWARLLLAETHLRSGDPERTVALLKPVLEGVHESVSALSLTGEAYLQMGDAKRASAFFQRALKTAPDDIGLRTTAAMAKNARGDSAGAIADLEVLASSDQGSRADLALVSMRLSQRDFGGALTAIGRLEAKLPDRAFPLMLRGQALTLKKDFAGAEAAYRAAAAKERGYFPAVARLAGLDMTAGKAEAARNRIEAFIKANPGSGQAYLALAEFHKRVRSPQELIQAALRAAVRADPTEGRSHVALIDQLINSGDAKSAMLAGQEAVAALPTDVDVLTAFGSAQQQAGDHLQAIATFKKLTTLQPSEPAHLVSMAEAYIALGDRKSASDALRRATEVQPSHLGAQKGLARLAVLDGRPAEATAIARGLQQRYPKDAAGFTLEGELESARTNFSAAQEAYRKALERSPTSMVAAKLHEAYLAGGKPAEGERLAGTWLKAHPKDSAFHFLIGDASRARGDLKTAEASYAAVLALEPNSAPALNNMASILLKTGRPGALSLAERANVLMPDNGAILDTLAWALDADGQLSKAVEVQSRAMALEPQEPEIALRMAKLFIRAGKRAQARPLLEELVSRGSSFPGRAEASALLKAM